MNPHSSQPPARISDFQKPEEVLELIENEHLREFVALVGMSQGAFANDGRPEWVVRAAGEFWRSGCGFYQSKRARSEAFRLGTFWALVKQLGPQLQNMQLGGGEKRLIGLLTSGELSQLIHSAMESAPIAEAAEFYAGLSHGLKTPFVFSPSSPFLVYLLLAVLWRDASKLKNTAQIHEWLEKMVGANLAGNRERLAKLLQKIRFPLTDKGGRPKGKPRKQLPS